MKLDPRRYDFAAMNAIMLGSMPKDFEIISHISCNNRRAFNALTAKFFLTLFSKKYQLNTRRFALIAFLSVSQSLHKETCLLPFR